MYLLTIINSKNAATGVNAVTYGEDNDSGKGKEGASGFPSDSTFVLSENKGGIEHSQGHTSNVVAVRIRHVLDNFLKDGANFRSNSRAILGRGSCGAVSRTEWLDNAE